MAVYDIISVPDYNNIRNIINPIISATTSGNTGYGQTAAAATAAVLGDSVTKTQWDNLRFDIVNCIVHQIGALPTIKTVNEGDTIVYNAAEPNYQYLTLATQAATNKFDLAAGQYAVESGTSKTYSSDWSTSVSLTITATFVNAAAARYFFNSGGKLRFTSSFTPSTSTQQNNAWRDTLAGAGTIVFGGNTPSTNFYTLTSTNQQFFTVSSTSTYAANNWKLYARCDIGNNSSGGATQVIITAVYTDGYVDPDVLSGHPATDNPPDGIVRGTIQFTSSHIRAVGALYPNLVANSFYIVAPTHS
jgi:hypothetical protein